MTTMLYIAMMVGVYYHAKAIHDRAAALVTVTVRD